MRERAGGIEDRYARLLAMHDLLAGLARQIGPALTLEPVLREGLTAMRRLVDFRGGTIGLVDQRGVYVAASDPPAAEAEAAGASAALLALVGTASLAPLLTSRRTTSQWSPLTASSKGVRPKRSIGLGSAPSASSHSTTEKQPSAEARCSGVRRS